jgi:hypothetical protein
MRKDWANAIARLRQGCQVAERSFGATFWRGLGARHPPAVTDSHTF